MLCIFCKREYTLLPINVCYMKRKLQLGCSRLLSPFIFVFFISAGIHAQTVTGKVTDEGGKKLSAVTVQVKGSTTGVTTDASGEYRINAGPSAVLVFSSVGYAAIEVP